MPSKDSKLKFKMFIKRMRVPFVIYADFEAFTENILTCSPSEKRSFTKAYQKHKPSGFHYYIKSFDESVFKSKEVSYTAKSNDEDVAQIFVNKLEESIKEIYQKTGKKKEMIFTEEDKKKYYNSSHCHICEEEIDQKRIISNGKPAHSSCGNQDKQTENVNWKEFYLTKNCFICEKVLNTKVKDHCHLTGKFRGAAHYLCNLNYQVPKFIPVIFHNLQGYDSHLFIKNLASSKGKINCIAQNEEKYISFSKEIVVDKFINKKGKEVEIKREIRFLDSFKFMASGLAGLANNLTSFPNLENQFQGEQLNLLKRKGVYPYDYMNNIDKFNETKLPPIQEFYSKLNDSGISEEDYNHAQKVWEVFNMKTMRDYHDLYLRTDVLLLADVFESFRNLCLENYKLDPAWYYTSPGLAWDACLKITKVELDLFSDYDMQLFIEKGIRGGVSMISTRHGKANNKYMKDFDPSKPSKFITYLDANNLYGWAMTKPLPTKNFKWMTEDELVILGKKFPAFLKLIFLIQKNFMIFIMIILLLQKE